MKRAKRLKKYKALGRQEEFYAEKSVAHVILAKPKKKNEVKVPRPQPAAPEVTLFD